jgi:hypothetical protein
LLSGFLAMFLRKGSGRHGAAGTVFFVSMLIMSASGAFIATFLRPLALNAVVALLTFYLVSTAWRAAKNRAGTTSWLDRGALLFVLAVGIAGVVASLHGFSGAKGTLVRSLAPPCLIFGVIALLCARTDLRMLRAGGFTGPMRIRRHLWRMCLALLIATLSFYPGQAKLFSRALRDTNVLMLPHVFLIGAMAFWMYRIRVRRRVESTPVMPPREMEAVPLAR